MIAASLTGMLCGTVLGSRFSIFSVILAHGLAVLIAALVCLHAGTSMLNALFDLACWSLCTQAGYAATVVAAARPRRAPSSPLQEI